MNSIMAAFLAATSFMQFDGPVKHRRGGSTIGRDERGKRRVKRKMAAQSRRRNRS